MPASDTLPNGAAGIELRAVSKWYLSRVGDKVHALADIEFNVRPHEFVSILGPSGCGKSTLLRIIAGLIPPSTGEVRIGGQHVVGPRRDVGVMFQQPRLLPWKTILGNVLLVAQIQGLDRERYRQRAFDLLRLVGLQGFERRYPWELSGGMQQRAGVARALVHDPTILLMDEPFAALDAMTRERMGLELLRIWEATHKTVVFVTHSISEAVFLSDRVVCLSARPGRILSVTPIPLPRPRRLAQMKTAEFAGLVAQLRETLFGIEDDDVEREEAAI